MKRIAVFLCCLVTAAGCSREPGSRVLTKGSLNVQVDEAVVPVMSLVVDEFQRQYPDAKVSIRQVEGRAAVANFANDSIRVIVLGRELNKEEIDALAASRIDYQEYRVGLSGIAVIANRSVPRPELRVSEVDSIFAGEKTRWSAKMPIDLAVGGANSSTNEIFRTLVLKGQRFALSATPFGSSGDLYEYVRKTRGALGIVNLAWLKGVSGEVTILPLGTPGYRPDSTEPAGKYYAPAQAYLYQGYYPVPAPIYIYSRDLVSDITTGFISFVASPPGQKVFLNSGLVPQSQPVRLVQLTSNQVN